MSKFSAAATRLFALLVIACGYQIIGARDAFAQTAQFQGTVLTDDATEKPLANAEIFFPALNRTVRSDSLGNFIVGDLPFGKHAVVIRLVGYESINTEITLLTARPPGVDLMLKPVATKLATVETKATATSTNGIWAIKLQEFDERRAAGAGRYLTLDYFEKQNGRPLSAFLGDKIPGVKFMNVNGARYLATSRGCTNFNCGGGPSAFGPPIPKACYMKIIINGIIRYSGEVNQPMFDIDQLNSQDIIGLEFYTAATTPVQYNSTGGSRQAPCGTLIVWTKGG